MSHETVPLDGCSRNTPKESRVGAYRVIAPLARGGTAAVYLAEHGITGDRVAIKVLDPFYLDHVEIVERMFAERTISQRVRHPGLVDITLADRSAGGVPYLVMEYLDGENLGALADRGRITIDALIGISAQIASAVAALHTHGIVHCDVKPDNVFVLYETAGSGWPRVKVLDYGVARRIVDVSPSDTTIAGTPSYMAPEQWRGAPGAKSDVYALGCMLYELLVGDHPFHGTLPQLMLAHCEHLPDRPSIYRSDLPPDLERLIVRAMSKDPGLRPTMSDCEAELVRLARDPVANETGEIQLLATAAA